MYSESEVEFSDQYKSKWFERIAVKKKNYSKKKKKNTHKKNQSKGGKYKFDYLLNLVKFGIIKQ